MLINQKMLKPCHCRDVISAGSPDTCRPRALTSDIWLCNVISERLKPLTHYAGGYTQTESLHKHYLNFIMTLTWTTSVGIWWQETTPSRTWYMFRHPLGMTTADRVVDWTLSHKCHWSEVISALSTFFTKQSMARLDATYIMTMWKIPDR